VKTWDIERKSAFTDASETQRSEPMQLDSGLGDTLLGEERVYLGPLIALKLYDLTHLVVVNESSVASKFL
jgi:hypothetical protein